MSSSSGSLDQGALPRVLRDVYVGRRSGTLRLSHGEEEHALQFHQGQLIDVTGGVADSLLATAVAEKELASADKIAKAEASARERGVGLGRTLSEVADIGSDALDDVRVAHARALLERIAKWGEGQYSFEPDPASIPGAHAIHSAATGDLIIDAVRAIDDPDVVRFALGKLDRPLAPSTDPLLRFQKVRLSPTEGYIMSRIDGVLSAEEIAQLVPASAEETLFSLCALYSAGLVDFIDLNPRPAGAAPARRPSPPVAATTPPAPRPSPPADVNGGPARAAHGSGPPSGPPPPAMPPPPMPLPRSASAPPNRPLPPPTPPKEPPSIVRDEGSRTTPEKPVGTGTAETTRLSTPPAEVRIPLGATPLPTTGPEQEHRRKEIADTFATLKGKTHFEILGLDVSATDSQVKEAYFRLARRFHPDVLRGPAYADLDDQIKAIFIRLGQAYEVLRSRNRRAQYESAMSRRAPTPVASPPASSGPGEPAPVAVPVPPSAADIEIEARLATDAIRQAEKLLEKEQYWDAIQLAEGHFNRATGKIKARARIVLAKCYLKNPNWAKRAEEQLLALVEEDPKHVEAHFLLGTIYQEKGIPSRALSRLKRVLELQPDHEAAQARVAQLEPDPPPEDPPSSGGFVKRLFGRGGGGGA